jgi:hypothetical protein
MANKYLPNSISETGLIKYLEDVSKHTQEERIAANLHKKGVTLEMLHGFFYKMEDNYLHSAVKNKIYNALRDIETGQLKVSKIKPIKQ